MHLLNWQVSDWPEIRNWFQFPGGALQQVCSALSATSHITNIPFDLFTFHFICVISHAIYFDHFSLPTLLPQLLPDASLNSPQTSQLCLFFFFFFWKQSTKSNLYCLSTTGCATIHWITLLKKTHSFSLRNHRVPILFFLTTVAVSFGVKCFYHIQKMLQSLRSFLNSGDGSFYAVIHVGYIYVLHCVRVKECVEVGRFFHWLYML